MRRFFYRLFFTRDDDLDLLQVMFLLCIGFFFIAFAYAGAGVWKITRDAWETFRWVFSILAIAGTPAWIAVLLARRMPKNSLGSELVDAEQEEEDGDTDMQDKPADDEPKPLQVLEGNEEEKG